MPPNHIRSTGDLRIAEIRVEGSIVSTSMPSAVRASGVKSIDFWERGTIIPPFDISLRS